MNEYKHHINIHSLTFKAAQKKREMGTHYLLHPNSTYRYADQPTVLNTWLQQRPGALKRMGWR